MANNPVATFGAAAAVALLLIGPTGCDEHPNPGQEEARESAPVPAPIDESPGAALSPAGEEGAELSRYTGPRMEQCIEVVGRVARCTSLAPFNELLVGDGTEGVPGWTGQELQRKAKFWLEPGARRQTCEQLVTADRLNPFKTPGTLSKMAESKNDQCMDFGNLLIELNALEALANVEL